MNPHNSDRDDVAELADLVAQLADRLKELQPEAAGALEEVKERAAKLSSPERGPAQFRSISSDSISVTEPDGTLRLLIASQGTFPTEIQVAGEIMQHARPGVAGMLFFTEEGDECGGLIFSGSDGYQGGSLTFDKYHGDQVIQFWHNDSEAGQTAALVVQDQPDVPIPELARRYKAIEELPEEDRAEAYERLREEGLASAHRMTVGRVSDGRALLALAAADGTVRIVVSVTEDGTPSIKFLDADQNVTWQAP